MEKINKPSAKNNTMNSGLLKKYSYKLVCAALEIIIVCRKYFSAKGPSINPRTTGAAGISNPFKKTPIIPKIIVIKISK